MASTCEDYRNPTNGVLYEYAGDIGDGLYQITLQNNSNVIVYCLMSQNNHGYVQIAGVPSNVRNTPIIDSLYSSLSPFISSQIIKFYRPVNQYVKMISYLSGSCYGISGFTIERDGIDAGINNSFHKWGGYLCGTTLNIRSGLIAKAVILTSDSSVPLNNSIKISTNGDIFNNLGYAFYPDLNKWDLQNEEAVLMGSSTYTACNANIQFNVYGR